VAQDLVPVRGGRDRASPEEFGRHFVPEDPDVEVSAPEEVVLPHILAGHREQATTGDISGRRPVRPDQLKICAVMHGRVACAPSFGVYINALRSMRNNSDALQARSVGNPGGRPKIVAEIRDLARQHSGVAIEALVKIARSGKSEAARVSAANSLLDRGWGKPTQPIAGDPEGSPVEIGMSFEERRRRAREMIEEAFREYPREAEPAVEPPTPPPATSGITLPPAAPPSLPVTQARRRLSPRYGGGWAG
jgi:hypothetical protein